MKADLLNDNILRITEQNCQKCQWLQKLILKLTLQPHQGTGISYMWPPLTRTYLCVQPLVAEERDDPRIGCVQSVFLSLQDPPAQRRTEQPHESPQEARDYGEVEDDG